MSHTVAERKDEVAEMKDKQQQKRLKELDERGRPKVERFGLHNDDDVEMVIKEASGGSSDSVVQPQVKHCLG